MKSIQLLVTCIVLSVFPSALFSQDTIGAGSTSQAQITPEEELTRRLLNIQNEAVLQQVKSIRDKTETEANKVGEAGAFTVSSELRTIPKIEPSVVKEIEGHKELIRRIFLETARQIEAGKDASLSFNKDEGIQLSRSQTESAARLRAAVEANTISLRSLGLAINAYISISEQMYKAADSETNAESKYRLYVQYTSLVYELSDVVIESLTDFEVSGVGEIKKIYDERVAAVDRIKSRIIAQRDAQKRSAKEQQLSSDALKQDLKKYDEWVNALDTSMTRWNDILSIIDKQKDWAKTAEKNISRLQLVRNDAQIQLDILKEVGIVKQTLNYLNGLEAVLRVNDLPLLRLDSGVVNELLGLGSPEKLPERK